MHVHKISIQVVIVMKIALSAVVFIFFLTFASGVRKVIDAVIGPMRFSPATGAYRIATSDRSSQGSLPVQRLWPLYPGARGHSVSEMTINGVRTQCEEWEVSAAPTQVLQYYRHQMLARGWEDVTGELFGPGSATARPLDDSDAMRQYKQTLENSLTLRRGIWNLYIVVRDGSRPWKTTARLFAAETSDMNSLLTKMSHLSDGKSFVAEEKSGDFTYRTTLSQSTRFVRDALNERMKSLGVSRWQVLSSPQRPTKTLMAIGPGKNHANIYGFARNGRDRNMTEVLTTEIIANE